MADLYSIRRRNLRALIAERENGEVAKAAGYPTPSYLSQMVGPKARRGITEKTARLVETALGLPKYDMDRERDDFGRYVAPVDGQNTQPPVEIDHPIPVGVVDPDLFATCAYIITSTAAEQGVVLPREKFTAIIKMMLSHPDTRESALQTLAEQLIALLK